MNDIRHCVTNTKMPHRWKRLIFNMWPFVVGGIPQGLLMNMDFKSWKIGLVFGTFMYGNGEGL